MSTYLKHEARQEARTPSDATLDTLKSRLPQMSALFRDLDAGYTPNFLDMMKALSEMVAFYTECDQIAEADAPLGERMSQNKCRFCS